MTRQPSFRENYPTTTRFLELESVESPRRRHRPTHDSRRGRPRPGSLLLLCLSECVLFCWRWLTDDGRNTHNRNIITRLGFRSRREARNLGSVRLEHVSNTQVGCRSAHRRYPKSKSKCFAVQAGIHARFELLLATLCGIRALLHSDPFRCASTRVTVRKLFWGFALRSTIESELHFARIRSIHLGLWICRTSALSNGFLVNLT